LAMIVWVRKKDNIKVKQASKLVIAEEGKRVQCETAEGKEKGVEEGPG